MRVFRFGIAAALVLGSYTMGLCEPSRDPAVGLAVDPPTGYTARAIKATGRYTAAFEVKSASDRDTGCKVAFQPAPRNGRPSQAEINTATARPEWRDLVRGSLGALYDVTEIEPFEHAGIRGAAATAALKPLPGMPARAADMQTLFVLLETPRGRTNLVCVAERQTFGTRKREFEAVARSLTVPQ